MNQIQNFEDFVQSLLEAGFSMGGGNDEGIFALIPWGWNQPAPYPTPVHWHTGDAATDPWEWRMRVLDERDDIAYGKFFFKKSGFIASEYIPYFLACRQEGNTLEEAYENGTVSHMAKQVYECVAKNEPMPMHAIKSQLGIKKEDASRFDRALVELQTKLYLTMCGRQQKISQKGEAFGWSSTVFCLTTTLWGDKPFQKAATLTKQDAFDAIRQQILKLSPDAQEKKIKRFIEG
ncbi:MAG: hypothetical protein GX096_08185 [Clostridiales bacterium]|nr:hypothetical protein [Clostridiales bacterium]